MTYTFKPAKRENVPLLIGLDGASGSGKTFSAHELAQGIAGEIGRVQGRAGRVFGIDTERRRMLHYADRFPFMHAEINPPFRPSAYGDAISAAEQQGADVIIIDSFSHEHEGEGGLLEWAKELEAGKDGQRGLKPPANWMQPKQAHKRLVNQMLAARAHIIVCMRSEEKMRVEQVAQLNDDGSPRMWNGKPSMKMVITPAADLPILERWVPICEKRFPFEITTSLLLTPDRPGVPVPRKLQEQHRPFFPDGVRITREMGAALAQWAMGGTNEPTAEEVAAALAALEAAARSGLDDLQREWRQQRRFQTALQGELDRLKGIAETARPTPTDEGPLM